MESSRILVSHKFKRSEDGFKHFIGYLNVNDVIRPLCIVLPPMSGYIKYFDNGGKNISFLIKDVCKDMCNSSVYLKHAEFGIKLKIC